MKMSNNIGIIDIVVGTITLIIFGIIFVGGYLENPTITIGERLIIILVVGYGTLWGVRTLNNGISDFIDYFRLDLYP